MVSIDGWLGKDMYMSVAAAGIASLDVQNLERSLFTLRPLCCSGRAWWDILENEETGFAIAWLQRIKLYDTRAY